MQVDRWREKHDGGEMSLRIASLLKSGSDKNEAAEVVDWLSSVIM